MCGPPSERVRSDAHLYAPHIAPIKRWSRKMYFCAFSSHGGDFLFRSGRITGIVRLRRWDLIEAERAFGIQQTPRRAIKAIRNGDIRFSQVSPASPIQSRLRMPFSLGDSRLGKKCLRFGAAHEAKSLLASAERAPPEMESVVFPGGGNQPLNLANI